MPRSFLVRQVMTTDVLSFQPGDSIEDAARALSARNIGGAPIVDEDGHVLGLLEDDDLIIQDSRLHYPTVISFLGAYIELPSSLAHFEDDLRKAVGATVDDVMSADPITCSPDDTLEQVATLMHENDLSRLPVVSDGRLVGIVSRGDLVRAIVSDPADREAGD
jgi:CBS domain-containing protein